jgi:hypothetical protein
MACYRDSFTFTDGAFYLFLFHLATFSLAVITQLRMEGLLADIKLEKSERSGLSPNLRRDGKE